MERWTQFNIKLPKSLLAEAHRAARKDGRTLSNLIRYLLQRQIEVTAGAPVSAIDITGANVVTPTQNHNGAERLVRAARLRGRCIPSTQPTAGASENADVELEPDREPACFTDDYRPA